MTTPAFKTSEDAILQLHSRKKIYTLVKHYAGCHFRELERRTTLPKGTLQYHLHYLTKHGLLTEEKNGNILRYFPRELKHANRALLGLLRQKHMRGILLFILHNKNANQQDLVSYLKLSPSTISWYMKKLVTQHIITFKRTGKELHYALAIEPNDLIQLLITYKESFLDRLVDQTIDMWDFGK